ncbi:PREDICTED: lysosomal protein NCU-G1 isoform X2 [Chrysochloris asiatica]|uniref:Glycosylated lysosomal membrane protein n=1 Tax=Chrysochloris asiatica TaxID=185453 RepID=A0A9B0TJ29_CHRAS|nr:PREDICTED: lysosomal protein NCU-G1 isoform X2 [Chrysochloris asiatica]
MCGSGEPRWGRGPCSPSPMLFLSLLLSTAPFVLLGEKTRQVSLEVIPGWLGSHQNLLHIRAVGTNSTLHYVWSSLGPPAVLLVATNTPHSSLSVNWSRLLSPEPDGGLVVLPKNSIQFSSALIFTRLLEFDSTNLSDVAAKLPGKPYPPYSLAEFSWNNISDSLDPATLSATFRGHPMSDPTKAFVNGSLAFRVQAFSGSGRPVQPPRLLHTADTCQLEMALVGASPRGNRSLFGLEVATLSEGPDCPSVLEKHSIDDEYAPAVFQSPIVRAFFGPQNFCAFNLTFGVSTGPGYWDQHYLSWSMLLGVGSPPVDALSPLVLGIMAVALGTPGLMLLGGGLILLLRHKQSSEYQPIN